MFSVHPCGGNCEVTLVVLIHVLVQFGQSRSTAYTPHREGIPVAQNAMFFLIGMRYSQRICGDRFLVWGFLFLLLFCVFMFLMCLLSKD